MKSKNVSSSRQKIIESTIRLFHQGKFSPSMSEVAAQSGVSKAALYYFFQSKKGLFAAVTEVMMCRFTEEVNAISTTKTISADQKLQRFFDLFFSKMQECQFFSQMIIAQAFSGDAVLMELLAQGRKHILSLLFQILKEGQENGVFRKFSVEAIAENIGALLDFLLLSRSFPNLLNHQNYFLCSPKSVLQEFLFLLQK